MKAFYFFGLLIALGVVSCETPQIEETLLSTDINGVGPISKLELSTIDDSLMKLGQERFNTECSNCHKMEYGSKAPDISDLLAYREPEWFMNFLLNKEEMLERDSLALITRKMFDEDCGADIEGESQALEILEYLRIYQIWLHEINAK